MKRVLFTTVLCLLTLKQAFPCDEDILNIHFDVRTSVTDGIAYLDILVPKETNKFYHPFANFVSPKVSVPLNNGYPEDDDLIYFGVSGDPEFLEEAEIQISYSLKPQLDDHGLGYTLCSFTKSITWREHHPADA